jgi:hypothetical protein
MDTDFNFFEIMEVNVLSDLFIMGIFVSIFLYGATLFSANSKVQNWTFPTSIFIGTICLVGLMLI